MNILIDTTKLLNPAEQVRLETLAKEQGLLPAELAELAIKKALYEHFDLTPPAKLTGFKKGAVA